MEKEQLKTLLKQIENKTAFLKSANPFELLKEYVAAIEAINGFEFLVNNKPVKGWVGFWATICAYLDISKNHLHHGKPRAEFFEQFPTREAAEAKWNFTAYSKEPAKLNAHRKALQTIKTLAK
jgi:hypothetical protein